MPKAGVPREVEMWNGQAEQDTTPSLPWLYATSIAHERQTVTIHFPNDETSAVVTGYSAEGEFIRVGSSLR
jgi:hypothetical protein